MLGSDDFGVCDCFQDMVNSYLVNSYQSYLSTVVRIHLTSFYSLASMEASIGILNLKKVL